MGLLTNRLGFQAMSLEDPSQPLLPPSALFETLGLGRSDAGILVNEEQALRLSAVQTCIRAISEDLGSTSHEIFQVMPDGSLRLAVEHRMWPILHDQPNPSMTAITFWAALLASTLGWGNGYALIVRDGAARAIRLVPLKSGKTAPVKINGALMYGTTQTDTGAVAYIEPANVLHVMGLSFDGVVGLSPIQLCKNAVGLGLAAEKFGAQFFGNGARATGIFSHPETLEPDAQENLKKSLREMATGENALCPMVLEEGMKWTQTTIPPNDAQFLETRRFQNAQIAMLYRFPMHLLQDLQRATNNNIEHQSLDYVRYCIRSWAVRIEQEVKRKLLSGPFLMEHNLTDMQRGDFASQASGIQILRNIGYLSNNDIARRLRENPMTEEEGGNVRMVQGAMVNITALMLPDGNVPDSAPGGVDDPGGNEGGEQPFDRIMPAFRNVFRDAVGRVLNRENRDAEFVRRAFLPPVISLSKAMYAVRYGITELTDADARKIDALLVDIAAGSVAWKAEDKGELADRLVRKVVRVLS